MPAVPHQAPRLVIVKEFDYRGKREEWQSIYSFDPGAAFDDATWLIRANTVISHLQPAFDATTSFIRAYGYKPNEAVSSWVHDYTAGGATPQVGTGVFTQGTKMSGDVAATFRFLSPEPSVKGKKVYIRKFWHGVYDESGSPDNLNVGQMAAISSFANAWNADQIHPGFTPWSPGVEGSGRNAVKCSGPHVEPYLTTRTRHRRGKRKKTVTTP